MLISHAPLFIFLVVEVSQPVHCFGGADRKLQTTNVPAVQDGMEDDNVVELPSLAPGIGTLVERWRSNDQRCCSKPAAPLVVDTHFHVWDEDPRPNRGLNQLGLIEDVVTEGWGEGIHLSVLVQPGFRNDNNTYITRSLERFPGMMSAELEYVVDYLEETLLYYHEVGVRGLRFKATSLEKYNELILPRLNSGEFSRIASFMRLKEWHFGVQLAAEVNFKWAEILPRLQQTEVPIIIDMFGRPDPTLAANDDPGTQAILNAVPAGGIWMELGGPFRVDPRCTYALPAAAEDGKCEAGNRVQITRRGTNTQEERCCPPETHQLLIDLAATFLSTIGDDHVVWGTDWPFISDVGVTLQGLLDAVFEWVPDETQRNKVLGLNAVRPKAVGNSPLYPFLTEWAEVHLPDADLIEPSAARRLPQHLPTNGTDSKHHVRRLQNPGEEVQDQFEDDDTVTLPDLKPGIGTLVDRWPVVDQRCCSLPAAPLVIDTHMHVWDEDPRPNRGLNQLGLIEDVLTEGWGVGVHLGVMVQPGFRNENNTYILKGLDDFPGRLSAEVEFVIDYPEETLQQYQDAGVRGLRFKATSLAKYVTLVQPRLDSDEFQRIVTFMQNNDWHWGVQLAKEAGSKWEEILETLQDTGIPIIIDMFGRPDPLLPAGEDIGTKAILNAAQQQDANKGKIWMEFGGPFRVDPRCTYAVPEAADPTRCLPSDRVAITQRTNGMPRVLCCPYQTHELLVSLAELFIDAVGEDYILWGTDWPFISDTGVTIRGLLDAVTAWIPDEAVLYKALGNNAVRTGAVGNSPLYPLLDLDPVPVPEVPEPIEIIGIASSDRPGDGTAFLNGVVEAKAAARLPTTLKPTLLWQNVTDSLTSLRTACDVIAKGVVAVVGPPTSIQTDAMMTVFSPFGLPVLGFSATDPALSVFPNFVRLVPADTQQSKAIGLVMQFYNWNRIAAVFQGDSYGVNGLQGLYSWAQEADANVFQVRLDVQAEKEELTTALTSIRNRDYFIIVANLCCFPELILSITTAAQEIGLFGRGYFWMFSDGVASLLESGRAGEVFPSGEVIPGLWGMLADAVLQDVFLENQTWFQPQLWTSNMSIYEATVVDALFALGAGLFNVTRDVLDNISAPASCLISEGEATPSSAELWERREAGETMVDFIKEAVFDGVTGPVAFDYLGNRNTVGFRAVNVQGDGKTIIAGRVSADNLAVEFRRLDGEYAESSATSNLRRLQVNPGPFTLEEGFTALFLGPTTDTPTDVQTEEEGITFLAVAVFLGIFTTMGIGCLCEILRRAQPTTTEPVYEKEPTSPVSISSSRERSEFLPGRKVAVGTDPDGKAGDSFTDRLFRKFQNSGDYLPEDPEPWHGFPPPTCSKPILGDIIAGFVKAIVELVAALTFAALMTPEELTPFLPVFLNYALFGYITSQLVYNLSSKYTTPVRTCNISGSIFLLDVLARAKADLDGTPDKLEVAVNTVLMASTIMAWLAGCILYSVGAFKVTQFVRFLSAPVKLGMQASLGYFLFATGFSIASDISWLSFDSPSDFGVYFELDLLPKWTITVGSAFFIFYCLNTFGWPYTIPTFVAVGIIGFHIVIQAAGISIEEAKDGGWLYPPPEGAGGNPLEFITRIYSITEISWSSIRATLPVIGTAAVITPAFSAVINLLLMETAFTPEEIGKSTLSYELRIDGFIQWLLAVIGGYSTSPTAGGTAVHRKIGARTNCGLFTSLVVHAAFLLIPGSTDVLQFVPKYVVGAVSLIVAISMLYGGLREGYRVLSRKEFCVVLATMAVSIIFGLESGMAAGLAMSFALFIRDTAAAKPVRLDVDSGLLASQTVWGVRSADVAAKVRGGIRIVCWQGYLFFAATQPALQEAEAEHLRNEAIIFLVLDFSAVLGMDDSTPIEFRAFVKAARKAHVSIVFCGCSDEVAVKLRKAGVLSEQSCRQLPDAIDLVTAAKDAGKVIAGESEVFYVSNADSALEFCELTLVLRSIDLCGDNLPQPTLELKKLALLLHTSLAEYKVQLRAGEAFSQREQGMTFVLLNGAVKSVVDLLDKTGAVSVVKKEDVVVYRSIAALEHDVCFAGSVPGVLEAVSDSTVLLLPANALDKLYESNSWKDVEIIWSQLAEFLAQTMHPMSLKATMHDVQGKYSSISAQLFERASAVMKGTASRVDLIKHALAGSDENLKQLSKMISVTNGGLHPVFGAYGRQRTRLFGTDVSMEVLPLVSSGHSPTAEAEEALVTFDVDGDKEASTYPYRRALTRTSTARSGDILCKGKTQDLLALGESEDEDEPEEEDDGEPWSASRAIEICKKGGEAKFLGKAQLMPQSLATSVTAAVEALNDAEFQCTNGFCVVFDATLYKAYFLLYEIGKKQVALDTLDSHPKVRPDVIGRSQYSDGAAAGKTSLEGSQSPSKAKHKGKKAPRQKVARDTQAAEPESEDSPSRRRTGGLLGSPPQRQPTLELVDHMADGGLVEDGAPLAEVHASSTE